MIIVESYPGVPVAEQRFEIVERKGRGHPDSLCDSIMESISIALSRAYLREFGTILHHNIDKGLLAAGSVSRRFGGGEVLRPMELTIGDRATQEAADRKIPVADIAVEAARSWLANNMRYLDPLRHVSFRTLLSPGSEELTGIFSRPGIKSANDTSATVGYFPLSPTEQTVLVLERHLNSQEFKQVHPETGEDIKVMGIRREKNLDLTIAMPLLCRLVSSERDYFDRKEALTREISEFVRRNEVFENISIHYNTLDERNEGLKGVYLSLTGTSAEDADSGQVGRGNRVNGVIAVNRPLGTEAAAGKNPVSHVGKIYNVLSHRMAERLYREIPGMREVYVYLVSRIGMPVDKPQIAAVQIAPQPGIGTRDVAGRVEEIVTDELSGIDNFCRQLIEGRYSVC